MAAVDKSRIKKDNNGRDYIVVIYGDTLSEIAEAYFGDHTKYNQLATLNRLSDPNRIVVGQTIYLSAATSGSTPSPQPKNTRSVDITQFGLLAGGATNELYATWTWSLGHQTQEYDIEWKWYRAGVWKYEDTTNIRPYSTFTIPNDGITSKIQFRVRPVPVKLMKGTGNNVTSYDAFETNLWTDWNECTYYVINKPDIPSNLSAELHDLNLTATVTNIDKTKASLIEFKLIKDGNDSTASTAKVSIDDTGEARHTFTNLEAGSIYKVCCRSYKDGNYSEWGNYSAAIETKPAAVTLEDPVAKSTTSIELKWSKSNTATKYSIEYTNDPEGFYEGVQSSTADTEAVNYVVNGLTTGTTYSFRVKAINDAGEESNWSDVKTCTIGSNPTAPTTWSSTTTAIAGEGETVSLYWMHNSTDGSAQKSAELTLVFEGIDDISLVKSDVSVELGKIDSTKAGPFYYKVTYDSEKATYTKTAETIDAVEGTAVPEATTTTEETVYTAKVGGKDIFYCIADHNMVKYTISASTDEADANATHSLIIDTHNYDDGATITWNVVTVGATGKASAVSMDRVVHIYSKPTIYLTVKDSSSATVGSTYYKVDYLSNTDTYVKTLETIEMVEGTIVSGKFTDKGEQVRKITGNDGDIFFCVVEKESLQSFPFIANVSVDTNTDIQNPVEYHLTVTANDTYETVDNFGKAKIVTPEEVLYSKHFTAGKTSTELSAEISAKDVSLDNGQTYTVKCVVAMSSGIVVEASTEVSISWAPTSYGLNAELLVDDSNCSVSIRPYCHMINTAYCRVNKTGVAYVVNTAEKYDYIYGTEVANTVTTTGEQVYSGTLSTGQTVYYAIVTDTTPVTDVMLSVYRREYDGTFTEIVKDLDASLNSFVTDPHPSLDYARYRVTAKDKNTSMISYSDIASYFIGESSIIIQWNDPYESYLTSEEELDVPNRSETMLKLKYNIDTTNSRDPDVSLIKYIGRKHPVSYYGTQVGEKASWKATVPKHDTETLYTLQRLQAWAGDVYVREPSGIGFWANVKVSMSKTHLDTVVPVTLDITRVEGGV